MTLCLASMGEIFSCHFVMIHGNTCLISSAHQQYKNNTTCFICDSSHFAIVSCFITSPINCFFTIPVLFKIVVYKRKKNCQHYQFSSFFKIQIIVPHSQLQHFLLQGEPSFHLFGFLICVSSTAARAFKSVLQAILLSSEG